MGFLLQLMELGYYILDCGKFYVMHDVTQKLLLMHRTVEILLAYLNFYAYISLVVVSLFLADACLMVIWLFVCSWQLAFAGYHYLRTLLVCEICKRRKWLNYYNQVVLLTKTSNCFRLYQVLCVHILYLKCKDTMLTVYKITLETWDDIL